MKPLLELRDVCYAYHSRGGETSALQNISFQVQRGEFIAVTGPSGCGKSTLLSLISGLLVPESGSIVFSQEREAEESDGGKKQPSSTEKGIVEVTDAAAAAALRRRIGYMLQKDHLFEWRTVYRNVVLGLEIQHRLNEESKAKIEKMLRDYGLERFRDARPSELSGGMRQRAALIRTLALGPELLLLDEPFSALDFQTRLAVCDDVSEILHREKKTALLVTHDLSEAVSMADRIIILTKRPARIRNILELKFEQEGLTPLERRSTREFQEYFNLLWEEMRDYEEDFPIAAEFV